MKQTKNQEEFGVIASFGRKRLNEAITRAREFVSQGPLQWTMSNQPVRKGVLLEVLDVLRPSVEVRNEHFIESWTKTR